jgi:thiol-disulfide isomerase/thioredoxin
METSMKSKLVIATVLLLTSNTAAQTRFRTPEQIPSQIMTAELQEVDGSAAVRLSNENRVIVLGMWAAWCGPCRFQMPELDNIKRKYHARGLDVVGLVSLEGHANSEEVLQYLRQMRVAFKSLWITKDISERLDPDHLLPITFVITNDGTVIRTFLGWDNKKTPRLLRKAVKEALKASKSTKDRKP